MISNVQEFSFTVIGISKESTLDEMDSTTLDFLRAVGSTDENPFECIDEILAPWPTWIPGKGPKGEIHRWKGYRKFERLQPKSEGGEND